MVILQRQQRKIAAERHSCILIHVIIPWYILLIWRNKSTYVVPASYFSAWAAGGRTAGFTVTTVQVLLRSINIICTLDICMYEYRCNEYQPRKVDAECRRKEILHFFLALTIIIHTHFVILVSTLATVKFRHMCYIGRFTIPFTNLHIILWAG
jgi:hypothetical protein